MGHGAVGLMRALVTGGGGFVGSALTARLLERGDDVRIFARGDYPAMREAGAETVRGDLRDAEAVGAAAAGCEHATSQASTGGGVRWDSIGSGDRGRAVGAGPVKSGRR